MPSVIATWSGQCTDAGTQRALLQRMEELALFAHEFFPEPTPVRYFDQVIEGRVVLDGALAPALMNCPGARRIVEPRQQSDSGVVLVHDRHSLLRALGPVESRPQAISDAASEMDSTGQRPSLQTEEPELSPSKQAGPMESDGNTRAPLKRRIELPVLLGEEEEQSAEAESSLYLLTSEVRLSGLEFRLYDWRDLYVGDDRISFVFMSVAGCPELSGQLVFVEDRLECQQYQDETIRSADWYLTEPRIHLRYYCEGWLDRLLAYVKHFYAPDLRYWRSGDCPGFEHYAALFNSFSPQSASRKAIDWLKKELQAEIDEWAQRRRARPQS